MTKDQTIALNGNAAPIAIPGDHMELLSLKVEYRVISYEALIMQYYEI